MGDANSAYTLKDIELFKRMDEFELMMFEQPLAYDDMLDHAKLQREIKTPICLDESIKSPEDARKAIELRPARIINVKLGRVGGHAQAKQVEEICRKPISRSGAAACSNPASAAPITSRCRRLKDSRFLAMFRRQNATGTKT